MRLLTGVPPSAPSGEITHRCSAKFKVLLHIRHLLLRSFTGVLLSLRYYRIKAPSGEITHRCSA